MATQQYPAMESNPTLVAPEWPRNGTRRKELFEVPRHKTLLHQELRAQAHADVKSWARGEQDRRSSILETIWERTKKSLGAKVEALRGLAAAGQVLSDDAKALLNISELVRDSFDAMKAGISESHRLPQVQWNSVSLPRAYAAVSGYLRAVNFDFEEETFERYAGALQEIVALEMAELWQVRPFLELALLERVTALAGAIENTSAPFSNSVTELSESTPKQGEESVRGLLTSLRNVAGTDWKELFERINPIEHILRQDPCGAYARMDFESRDVYRKTIAHLARSSNATEPQIALKALELASQQDISGNERVAERRSHIGYYLIGEGRKFLDAHIGYRPTLTERMQAFIKVWPDFSYILGIELLTFAIVAAVVLGAGISASGFAIVALFFLPAAECAVTLINQLATSFFPPKALPKLDFSKGVPREFTTMVVVPTLLTSEEQMKKAVRDLEIRFLANRDANLHFALLTDPPDAAQEFDDKDNLAGECTRLVQGLNEKYARDGKGSFYVFHRHRTYNEAEGIWMGWERKRGKLLDFNKLLLGGEDYFPIKAGNLSLLHDVKYVITLDLDTQLPRDAARKLVGAMAHPLNRAVIDAATNTVIDGYGILQPRVDISIQSANRSRLATIFSSDAGFDVYSRAVSDVYQDLFGEGSFTGKGIYEVATFQQVLEHRFPCNTVLSHDMIEGAYARAGLVSDVEVVDDYPSHMSAFSRRKHRWVRGDWQILFWLLPRVPDFFGKMVSNPLSIVSRWKILDNLRRSLTEIATFAMLLSGWLFFPAKAIYWTVAALAVIALPSYAPFLLTIARAGSSLRKRSFWKRLGSDFAVAQANLFLHIACLCHQSLVTVDAVVRTIVRMTITHERLLEWETAAEAEANNQKKSPFETYLEIAPWLAFFAGLFLAVDRTESFFVALPLLVLWGMSKPIVQWLNLPSQPGETKLRASEETLLRHSALRTWRLFREFSTAEENWLVPDTIQEPEALIVHRISTTNLGLLLNSRLAATDLGFFTVPEFLSDTERTFDTIDRMPKLNGQMYNWYDTRTLEPVRPRFVSTVDNGNLVCCLWTVKQGCLGAIKERIFRTEIWRGIIDHIDTIEELLRQEHLAHPLLVCLKTLRSSVENLGASLSGWPEALEKLEREAVDLDKKLCEKAGSDAAWWAHELCLRVTHLSDLIHDFAPWMAPQFAKYCRSEEIQRVVRSKRLTLESLPKICAALDQKLASLMEDEECGVEEHAALQLLRSSLARSISIAANTAKRLERLAARADGLAKSLDFSSMYDAKKKALSIGYNAEEQQLAPYYYDLLASEARAAAFVAVAKNEVPQETWLYLERRYTNYEGERVLLSWTGTMFEYLMPTLWMRTYPNTTLDQTTQGAVKSHRKYAERRSIPWGISEASCSKLSVDGHFHYEAFGIPGLAMNREMSRDLVVSPYSTFLALMTDSRAAAENIQKMKELGWLGRYGFYEAVDFTSSRVKPLSRFEVVPCWLAHHQGMSLMAVANVLCNGSSRRRFHAEPMVAATERLLHEKIQPTMQGEISTCDEESLAAGGKQPETGSIENWSVPAKLDIAS
jgi:cyclic beta-1,2-glucan synthetase